MAIMDDTISEPSNVVGVSSTGENCVTHIQNLWTGGAAVASGTQLHCIGTNSHNICFLRITVRCIFLPMQWQSVSIIEEAEPFAVRLLNRVKRKRMTLCVKISVPATPWQ